MPRDSTDTKERILSAAELLFATRGLHQATSREITEAAGQRNNSAIGYHFGSRSGVIAEILRRHDRVIDRHRGERAPLPHDHLAVRDLVGALVHPYAASLETESGRHYLRIVNQLSDEFAVWRHDPSVTHPNLLAILDSLEHLCPGPAPVGRERVIGMIMLLAAAMAERARLIELGGPLRLDDPDFIANLIDVMVATIEAPVTVPAGRHTGA